MYKRQTKERSALIRTFNKEFGQYLSNMITETSTAYDLAKAYKEVCNNLQGKLYLESMQNDMKKICLLYTSPSPRD